jgi:hypothetical protein
VGTENDEQGVVTPDLAEAAEGGEEEREDPLEESETFDREYVQRLRDEAATQRIRAKRADEAEARLRVLTIEAATRGVLTDPTDLPWSEQHADDDGWPDADKIRAAAEELVGRKPHLARPSGDVGQGRHTEEETVSLAGLLRVGA